MLEQFIFWLPKIGNFISALLPGEVQNFSFSRYIFFLLKVHLNNSVCLFKQIFVWQFSQTW